MILEALRFPRAFGKYTDLLEMAAHGAIIDGRRLWRIEALG